MAIVAVAGSAATAPLSQVPNGPFAAAEVEARFAWSDIGRPPRNRKPTPRARTITGVVGLDPLKALVFFHPLSLVPPPALPSIPFSTIPPHYGPLVHPLELSHKNRLPSLS